MKNSAHSYLFRSLVVLLILAGFADVVLSYLWITDPSWGEANPVMAYLWLCWGYGAVIGWKVLFTGLAVGILMYVRHRGRTKTAIFGLIVCNVLQISVIGLLIWFRILTT